MNRSNKGFTLIELLVVIAIIGVLSSIVLASLNTARGKGADAAIKGNLEGTRIQAEMVYDSNGCYTDSTTVGVYATVCSASYGTSAITACSNAPASYTIFNEPTIKAAILAASKAAGGTDQTKSYCAQLASSGAWALATPLKTDASKAWCVDSTGASRQVSTAAAIVFGSALCGAAN